MIQRLLIVRSVTLAFCLAASPSYAETAAKAPHCALSSIDNVQQYDLQQFRGKVVYIDFWASWCPSCVKSFPFLNSLERDFKDRGLQVIAVNLDEELDEAAAFLKAQSPRFTLAVDASKQCAQDFGVMAMPASYLIDRNGVIRHRELGFRAEATAELRALTEQLLAERVALQ